MLHEPATPAGSDPAAPYKASLGIRNFALYAVFYAGFVAINLLNPQAMATVVVAGLNLVTVYGMALIFLAVIQALIYHVMCKRKEDEFARLEASPGDDAETTAPQA